MALAKLQLPPVRAGYTVKDGAAALAVALDGGRSRLRADVLGASRTVSVTWAVSAFGYRYLRAFLRSSITEGSEPFLLDLVLDEGQLTEHEVLIVPGSLSFDGSNACSVYRVSATIEAVPSAVDADYDGSVIELWEAYGVDAPLVLADIEPLANIYMPDTIGP